MDSTPRQTRVTEKGHRAGMRPMNFGQKWPTNILRPEEVIAVLNNCSPGVPWSRNRAVIAVLYRAGLKVSEALALEVADIDGEHGTLRVRAGQRRERIVGMDERAFELIEEWLTLRAARRTPGSKVFCTFATDARNPPPGRAISSAYVRRMLKQAAKRADLKETRVHPEAFRHTLAAELILEEGWPLMHIQAQLGIVTLGAMERLLNDLGFPVPDAREVVPYIHSRVWTL
jgi:site-specific recombinase XerD